MAKLSFAVFIVFCAIVISCNSNNTSFEDSVPYLHTLTTNVSPEGSGTVYPSGGEFTAGNNLTLEALPSEGFIFDHWDDDLTGRSNPDSLFFTANRTVTAYFVERYYPLSIEIIGEGYIREAVIEDSPEVTVRLTAISSEGWYFERWEGSLTGNENPEILEVGEEKNVTAIFRQYDPQGFVINVEVEGEGSVEYDPLENAYDQDEEVTVTAVAASGWSFTEWRGDLTGNNNPETIVMNENKNITAVFEESTGPDASNSSVTVNQNQLQAGGNAIVTVELRDYNNNPVGGLSHSDFSISVSGNATFGTVSETSPGSYQFTITNYTAEQVEVTVTSNGVVINDSAVVTFRAGDPDAIEIEKQPEESIRNQPVEGPPTVRVLDEFGNGVPGVDVIAEVKGGALLLSVSGDLTVTTDDSGVAAFTNILISYFIGGASFTIDFSASDTGVVTSDSFIVR